jgi:hypothetical protein
VQGAAGSRRRRARGEGPAGRAGGQTRTSARGERARQERSYREARSGSACRVQEAVRKTRSRAGAGALQARRGEEAHGAWNSAHDVEFGSARTVQEADV